MIRVKSARLQDYLLLYGYVPQYIKGEFAYYPKDLKIYELLDRYAIKYEIQPNANKSVYYQH